MKLWLIILTIQLLLPTWQLRAETSCDRKSEPWRDENCQMPDKKDPNHACRYVQYLKANAIDPLDPSLIQKIKLGDQEIDYPDSYEHLAYEVCESYKSQRCAESASLLYKNHSILLDKAVKGPSENLQPYVNGESKNLLDASLSTNFAIYSAENKSLLQMMDQIFVEMKSLASQIGDKNDLNTADKKLSDQFSEVRKRMADLSVKEARLNSIIDQTVKQIGLNSERALTNSAGFDCDFAGVLSTDKYNKQIKLFIGVLNDMRQEIKNASIERREITNLGYLKSRYLLYASFAASSNASIDAVMGDLQKDLWLVRMMWKVAEWWSTVRSNGFAGRLHTLYYYYSEPLRILRVERERAIQFKDLIRSNPLFRQETGAVALKSMDDKIQLLDKEIVWIEGKGWKGLLEIQKLSANKRAELLPDNARCQQAVKVFSENAQGVDSLGAFDLNSPRYKLVVDTCTKAVTEVAK